MRARVLFGPMALFGLLASVCIAAPAAAEVRPVPVTVSRSTLAWSDCAGQDTPAPAGGPVDPGPGEPLPAAPVLQCATVRVPLDHARPAGRQVPIALYRVTSPNQRGDGFRGSLVLNPGGPGGSGREFLRFLAATAPPVLVATYDLVAFDPRGVGASDGLACGAGAGFPYSVGGDPVAEQLAAGAALAAACLAEDAAMVANMGTTNVVRDLDRVREALGEDTLDFLGYSYGTRLGAVYAELFPDRVGRFVLDGPLDPQESYRSASIEQMASFEEVLQRFFVACDAELGCPFRHGGTAANFAALLDTARRDGLAIAQQPRRLGVGELVSVVIDYLYVGTPVFRYLADGLAAAASGDATALALDFDASAHAAAPIGAYYAVTCADADAVYDRADANFATWSLRERAPVFAPGVLEILTCGAFPTATEPAPGLTNAGLPPVLIIGTTHDPATPYAGAQALHDAWAGSALVSFEGDGHTVALSDRRCIDDLVLGYLVLGDLPVDGTRCRPERTLGEQLLATSQGVVVIEVDPLGAAAGILRFGDVLHAVDGLAYSPALLRDAVTRGVPFRLTVRRSGVLLDVTLTGRYPPYWMP